MLERRFLVLASRAALFILFCAISGMSQMVPPGPSDTGLGGTNSITGIVLVQPGGRIQRSIAIKLETMTKGDRVVFSDENGKFEFRGLPSGEYTIRVEKEKEFEPYVQPVSVVQPRNFPGQAYNISVRLKYKQGVTGTTGVVNAEMALVPPTALEHYKKASELASKGDPKGAIDKLRLAIAAYPKFASAYNDMGVQYLKLKDMGRADDAFVSAINIDKAAHAPLLNHGMIMFEIKRFDLAEPVFRDVINAKSDSAVGHFFLGQTLANLGKFDEAQKELTEALSLGGENMAASFKEAHRLLAIIYSTRGDKKRQAAELETYLKLAPETPDAEKLRELIKQLRA
jgi:tetratricopeptide (TPR) repeat protein